ncbi:hypothetical protein JB92DRAFT_2624706, partial [Gautieria morchelliformis]
TCLTALRVFLPALTHTLSHTAGALWFGQGQTYSQLDASVGHVDWYNVQFYSQGTPYTTCTTLISVSGDLFLGMSVLEIVASGVPQQKVVIG